MANFIPGQTYNRRRDIHSEYGGQQQGGICTPQKYPIIFLFTGDSGSTFGYQDEYRPDGTFWYTGEGQIGDMSMIRGNLAIKNHQINNKALALFESTTSGNIRFVGWAQYIDHHWEERLDRSVTTKR